MFKEISAKEIEGNLIKAIADEWMLISAGNERGYNMMTASWGFAGEVWGNDSVMALIRPQRYTMDYVNQNEYFTLSFYGDRKDIHSVCGSKSGRNVDKTALTGLTPVFSDDTVYFDEARLVIICKKQYVDVMKKECFIDKTPLDCYKENDFHYMIIGKIEKVLVVA
ncbi:MAG: flavin reductase [Clostridia bacterium]|nr:flavin reductase [Clostridia bacterium]